jgi:potassium-dependent mechanosensitive channel
MIPNSVFLENRVTNWTLSNLEDAPQRPRGRGLRHGPAAVVMDILLESAGRHGLICKDPAPFAVFEDFGDNALVFCSISG